MKRKPFAYIAVIAVTVIAISVIISFVWNVSGDSGVASRQDHVSRIILTKPDSAKLILDSLSEKELKSEKVRFRYIVQNTLVDFMRGIEPDNDSLIRSAVEYYQSHNDRNMRAQAELCAGLVYAGLGEDSKAVRYYAMAAKDGEGHCDDRIMFLIYSQWGWAIRSEMPYSESINKFKKARRYAENINDSDKIIRTTDLIGWEYLFIGDYAKAHAMFDSAITMAGRHRYANLWMLYKSKATAYEYQGKHREALSFIDKAIAQSSGTDTHPLMAIKGVILTELNLFDSADIYIERGRQKDYHYQQASYYYDKSVLEEKRGDYKKALDYKSKYALYLDSSFLDDKRKELIKVEKLYNYSQMLAERNEYEQESHRKTLFIILIASIFIFISAIVAYAYRRFRKRISEALAVKENMLTQSLRQIKDKNYELMQTKQSSQEKEIELMESLSNKDKELENLREKQKELKERIFRMDEVIIKIESLRKMNERKKIVSAESIALSAQEQQNLLDSTNLCYDGFVDRLKERFDELSSDDLCLCCLLKIGISSQDQCILLQINDSTLRKRKYRLKNKKMQLPDNFDTLDSFICRF